MNRLSSDALCVSRFPSPSLDERGGGRATGPGGVAAQEGILPDPPRR